MEKTTVNQVRVHDVEVDKISVDSIAGSSVSDADLLDLADVVKAIENTSSREISTINHGFDSLKSALLASFVRAKKMEDKRQTPSKKNREEDGRQLLPQKRHEKAKNKSPEKAVFTKTSDKSEFTPEKHLEESVITENSRRDIPKAKELRPTRQIVLSEEHEQPRAETKDPMANAVAAPTGSTHKSLAETSKNSALINQEALSGYRLDDRGHLHNERGAFASKIEKKQYEKAQAITSGEDSDSQNKEPEKQTSLLKQAVFSLGRIALIGAGRGIGRNGLADKDSNIKTTAGVALGGSYFLAAQEAAVFLSEVKESLKDSGIESFGDAVKKAKDSATGAIGKVVNAGVRVASVAKAVQVYVAGDNPNEAEEPKPKESRAAKIGSWFKSKIKRNEAEEPKPKESRAAKIGSWFKSKIKRNDAENPPAIGQKAKAEPQKNGVKKRVKELFSVISKAAKEVKAVGKADKEIVPLHSEMQTKSAPSWLKSGTNPLFRFFSKATIKASKADLESLAFQKQGSQASEQRHQEMITALGDIEDAIKGVKAGGGGSGIFGDALDFIGDKKKRKRARGTTKASRATRASGVDFPERTQRAGGVARGSAYGSAGRTIPSVASSAGTAVKGSMGGAALKAGGAVLSKLALPLTVAMAAYDGFSGYNDKEGQKEAFKLQDGQEASFGQKAAMATGSILSLGGLTEMIGFSGADISKGIYKAFGGKIEGEESSLGTAKPSESGGEQSATINGSNVNTTHNTDRVAQNGLDSGLTAAVAAPVPSIDVTSASAFKPVEDIEQVESVSKINEKAAAQRGAKTTGEVKTSVFNSSDPEIVKLLKSIDKKLDGNSRPAPFSYRSGGAQATNNRSSGGIPSDFSNENQRRQANNLG